MKRTISFSLSVVFFFSAITPISATTPLPPPSENTDLQNIEVLLEKDPYNPILQIQKKMLERKKGKASRVLDTANQFGWRGTSTGLSKERSGGFELESTNDFVDDFDVLTGEKAIDESLQLGSIGRDRGNSPEGRLLRNVEQNIQNYQRSLETYPSSLEDFRDLETYYASVWWDGQNTNIADLADMFTYQPIEKNGAIIDFVIALKDKDQSFDIDTIEPVDIKSHPWDEMLEGKEWAAPNIATVVPKDMLFVYFENPSKSLQLEKIMIDFTETFGDLYMFGELIKLKPKMMQRLGIPDLDALVLGLEEAAFVSEDLSFIPRTDYALILKFKNDAVEKGFDFLFSDNVISKKVGDYTVIATHEDVIQQIEAAAKGDSLAEEKDFHYALTSLESKRDGLAYLSDAFIRKLTGPAYRINSRRRNTVLHAMEPLQYSVFAYRRITGEWPTSFKQMVEEEYLSENTIFEQEKYSIDDEGHVHHADWGTIWEITPVNRVDINQLTYSEKVLYDQFSERYHNYFREFFDPIGIAFTVSDQLMLHTIILPLIDESEYNWLKAAFGNNTGSLSFLFDPDRLGAVNIAAGFSLDDLLAKAGEEEMNSTEREKFENSDLTEEERKRIYIYAIEAEIAEDIDLDFELVDEDELEEDFENSDFKQLYEKISQTDRLFDFVGDELFLGIGEDNSFTMNNIADIDIWFGVKLKDQPQAEAFMKKLYEQIAEEFGGDSSFGLFSISSKEPISNEYNGVKYYLIPTGFINLYYIFFDDTVYFTISQLAVNNIIDAKTNGLKTEMSDNLKRSLAFIGAEHHIATALDMEKMAGYEIEEDILPIDSGMKKMINERVSYLSEAMTLAEVLPSYEGNAENVRQYYRSLPEDFLNGTFSIENGEILYETETEKITLSTDDRELNYMTVSQLIDSDGIMQDIRDQLRAFRSAALGLSFTAEGLDVRMALGNPFEKKEDRRFTYSTSTKKQLSQQQDLFIVGGGIITVLVLVIILIALRKKKQ